MSEPVIEYFYAAHSAFAYLGSRRFMEIAKAAGRRIVHRPYDLRRALPAIGSPDFKARTKAHYEYYFGREIQRWSEWRDAPVLGYTPTYHQNDIGLPNCVLIAGTEAGLNIDDLAHRMLESHWKEDSDLADRETLMRLCDQVGIGGAPLLESADSPEIRAIYESYTEDAIARSVFGSPTYFVDGDMFYGQDRLEMVERALTKPFA
ncbi:MAG: 2-hydroxychromene-2-carboxylate isomerase [Minwuia sp.]|uniref:2-hydroxychromene-2-carboxylate isomerase n=1 Tax=Minwuia sp. TaxID=2493630 RepID=UPI003A8B9F5C